MDVEGTDKILGRRQALQDAKSFDEVYRLANSSLGDLKDPEQAQKFINRDTGF